MFVRKKKNRSGSTSVVVVDKSRNRFRELVSIGTGITSEEIDSLCRRARQWIALHTGERDMFAEKTRQDEELMLTEHRLSHVENILLNGTQLLLNRVFSQIGFDAIEDEIFKHLVVSRICRPHSKAATVDYLKSYFDEDVELHRIYRYLDKLYTGQQEQVQRISVEHTRKLPGGEIGLVFYDVTTLYFETDRGDDLRKPGFSKDGKHSQPQIVLGLLVSRGGYPLAYSIHEGNKYEGHTMIPVIEQFVSQFGLTDFVVVADSGLMNRENIEHLQAGNYKYILGARIKNERQNMKEWILSQPKKDGLFYECQKDKTCKLIVGYCSKRAGKDARNRAKGVRRIEKEYKSGAITKDKVNKRGYNKFLDINDDIRVSINYDRIAEDARWDGWKGCLTNTNLAAKTVYEQYSDLWQVERAFRVSKGTLELRPMFHFTPKRIHAHVCICFAAYKVYKELERILKANRIHLSVDKVLDITKTITTLKIKLPESGLTLTKTMLLTAKHRTIAKLFDDDFWKSV